MPSNERNKLIDENMRLVSQVIKDKVHDVHNIGIFTYDDLFQTGCIGLCKAADTFKPGRGQFSTYAYILIRNEIFDALEYATRRRKRETLAASEDLPGERDPEPYGVSLTELSHMLNDAQAQTS